MNSYRERYNQQQKQREELQHKKREDAKDLKYGTIFLKDKFPPGISEWRPDKGQHLIDIIPFFVGSNHPKIKKDSLDYCIDIWLHRRVGAMNDEFICNQYMYKQPCPIEEYIGSKRLSKDEWARLKCTQYTVYLVWVHSTREEEKKGIQIWRVPFAYFEKDLDERKKLPGGKGGTVLFWDPDLGKSISFTLKVDGAYEIDAGDGTKVKKDSLKYAGIQFVDRLNPIPNEILDQAFSLDEVIKMKSTYQEVHDAFYGKKSYSDGTISEVKKEEIKGMDINDSDMKEKTIIENKCPNGGTFGKDIQQLPGDVCNTCNIWDECSDVAAVHKANKETTTTEPTRKLRRREIN